jgi:hypothetical protein
MEECYVIIKKFACSQECGIKTRKLATILQQKNIKSGQKKDN